MTDDPQPTWDVRIESEEPPAAPSRFVELTLTVQLEVEDLAALQQALEDQDGPARDDAEAAFRQVPAVLVGRLMHPGKLVVDLPGVRRTGSGMSVGDASEGQGA